MDCLIYKGPHWIDLVMEKDPSWYEHQDKRTKMKYDCRYRPGDLVDIYPDGTLWENGKWRRDCKNPKCVFGHVEGLKYSPELKKQLLSSVEDEGSLLVPVKVVQKRRVRLRVEDIDAVGKNIEITATEWADHLEDKAIG